MRRVVEVDPTTAPQDNVHEASYDIAMVRAWGRIAACVAIVLSVAPAATSSAASRRVEVLDDRFSPRELHVEPGDEVVWVNRGERTHTVTADDRSFDSRDLAPGESFSRTFSKEGYYFYHCRHHGGRRFGMWGVVVVGDPPPPSEPERRPRIRVPQDFPTIQRAVDAAPSGATIVVGPGRYRTTVIVQTPDLVIRGVDRFRTVLDGRDRARNGVVVDGVRRVKIANLTVRDYLGSGIFVNAASHYTIARVDLIKNRTFGVHAVGSTGGVIRRSFGWGSGESAFHVAACGDCGTLVERVRAGRSFFGYSSTNATGVVVRRSRFRRNGVGVAVTGMTSEQAAEGRGALIYANRFVRNNYTSVPAAGLSETFGAPFGTGIWISGADGTRVAGNRLRGHARYGVLVSRGYDGRVPSGTTTVANRLVPRAGYDLAWDGAGADNCFARNRLGGETSPPEMQTIYACSARPFAGVPWPPVEGDVTASMAAGPATRDQREPPEPRRPRCQRGAPGCRR